MEAVSEEPTEAVVEFEDIQLSDSDERLEVGKSEANFVNIDYNNRLASKTITSDSLSSDDCDTRLFQGKRFHSFAKDPSDKAELTSSEELELSDDGESSSKENVYLQKVEGVACVSRRHQIESSSSFDHSSTTYKEECVTDAEYISEEESDSKQNQAINDASADNRWNRKLSFGLSVSNLISSVKDVFSSKQTTLSDLNVMNPFASSIDVRQALPSYPGDTVTPLMTCLEFLKSDLAEDELTDVEDFAPELGDSRSPSITHDLEDVFRYRGKTSFKAKDANRSSWTVEMLSDDEASSSEVAQNINRYRNLKRNSIITDNDINSLTDEELFDLDCPEWTETDDSGSVRQITQIKTETSIKLEGDGMRRSLRKIPKKESSDEEKKSTDSEQEDLSFTEKKSFFQRLSLTSDTLPATQEKWAQDVSLDDLPMAEGEIVQEQISFEDKFKMFEPDEGNRKKIQKREKPEQPTVYLYNFTKNDQTVSAEEVVSELERTEGIVNGDLSPEVTQLQRTVKEEVESSSAVTLEKVEQDVYSLISEVNKEEKELNSYQEECSDSDGKSPSDDHKQISGEERFGAESETDDGFKNNDFFNTGAFEKKSYTTMIEAEESISSYQALPLSDDETERKFSIDLCKKEEHNEAIKLDVDDDSIEETKHYKMRPSNLEDLSSVVDSHIKSEILREEIDQSIEESPLEVKHIVEDLEHISESDDHKCNVYKHIRTEIFTQELGQDIESGSPERKELGAFSLKKSDSPSDASDADEEDTKGRKALFTPEVSLDKKSLSPQVSEESCGHTDEISSEGIVVEPDDHLVEYEEAIDEHSLTEQLQALASDSMNAQKPFMGLEQHQTLDFRSQEYEHMSSGMSSTFPDLDIHRRSKEIGFSRHDKKEIRSLKSTKQVSTIEEHSSIESCDSPQELVLHELPEKYDSKEHLNEETQKFDLDQDKDQLPIISEPRSSSLSSQSNEQSDKGSRMSRSDSKSSQGKKSDSDAEGSKFDNLSDASGKKEKESCSSSGETESPYYSVETSDSGKTPRSTPAASRPCSSEFDVNVFSGHGSEYETCVTSQEASGEGSGSYATAVSSQEISYATACSSFSHSSRESAYSVDSESSGHLASVEVSSEASETLVPSAQEMELEFAPDLEMPVLDEEPASEESVKEPYDMDIPESIIREGVEMPFMQSWELNKKSDDEKMKQLPQQWSWQYATESEITDKFEVLDGNEDKRGPQVTSLTASEQSEDGCTNKVKSENAVQCYPQAGTSSHTGPSHRRSYSSVIDIIPDKELMEQQNSIVIEEEPLSVSESSATHSEQTWQTSSVDTAVQLSSHAPTSSFPADGSNLMSDSLQETPPEKELTPEQSYSSQHGSSFLQLNGPIEVDYNPEYDNPEGDDSDLTTNQNQTPILYETDGLQFDLELEGSSAGTQAVNDNNSLPSSSNVHDLEFDHESLNLGLDEPQALNSSSDYDAHNIASFDAEKPEAQQEQSFNFNDYRNHESESYVCSDFASYLPESDQCDLLPGGGESLPPSFESEINIPLAESVSSSEGVSHRETRSDLIPDRQSMESLERGEIIDTSPEDERYESVKPSCSDKSPSDEINSSPALKFSDNDILNPESDYSSQSYSKYDEVPGTDLYTHQEEDEFDLRGSDVYPSPIPSLDDDKQSTPSSEAFHGRKFFPRSGDTSAASSLQEFERLEAEIAAGRISRSSIDSSEKVMITKSGEHDDVSMSSLTEFEKLERECVENESEKGAMEEMMLSEIEEGIESQCSDALEILQESMHDVSDLEYEQRRLEMEELIKVTQSNVEKFQEETASEGFTSDECTVLVRVTSEMQDTSDNTKSSSKEEGNTDVDESENLPLTQDKDNTIAQDSSSSGEKNCLNGRLDLMVSSTDSMDPSSSTATHATYQFETDSVMSSSLNSAQASGEECTIISSTDTLEPESTVTYTVCESGETMHLAKSGDSVIQSSKGALACKLEELQATNGAKQQMEMFLSKLTDDTVLMDDFTSHSFPDIIEGTDHHTEPDDLIETTEAAQGISSSGDAAFDSDDLSRSTTTTTTRIVTTVTTGDGEEGEQEESGTEDLRHSVEVILNQFMSDGDTPKQDSHLGSEE